MDTTQHRTPGRPADLVRWGPVVAGVVIGLGLFALLNSLWIALAYDAGDGWISGSLNWFIGGSAAVALLAAGLLAGMLAGVRGVVPGLVNGATAWGLLFLLSLTAIIPGTVNLMSGIGTGLGDGSTTVGGSVGEPGGGFTAETALWTGFWSLLIGLVLAALGGVVGGTVPRPVVLAETRLRGDDHRHDGGGQVITAASRVITPVRTGNARVGDREVGDPAAHPPHRPAG